MEIMNERFQIKQAIKNWIGMYGLEETYGADKRGRQVGKELMALDQETATTSEVTEIIGVSWVYKKECGECGEKTWDIVEIGEIPNYESQTAYLCLNCLKKAVRLLENN